VGRLFLRRLGSGALANIDTSLTINQTLALNNSYTSVYTNLIKLDPTTGMMNMLTRANDGNLSVYRYDSNY
jgi:hypothetical protein